MIYHSSISVSTMTLYFAKEKVIELLIKECQKESNIFVRVKMSWDDQLGDSGIEDFIARREVIKQLIGIEYSKISLKELGKLFPVNSTEVLEWFDCVYQNKISLKTK